LTKLLTVVSSIPPLAAVVVVVVVIVAWVVNCLSAGLLVVLVVCVLMEFVSNVNLGCVRPGFVSSVLGFPKAGL